MVRATSASVPFDALVTLTEDLMQKAAASLHWKKRAGYVKGPITMQTLRDEVEAIYGSHGHAGYALELLDMAIEAKRGSRR